MQTENTAAVNADIENVLAAMGDFDASIVEEEIVGDDQIMQELDAISDDPIVEETVEVTGDADEDFLDELNITIKRQESYEAQTAEEMPDIEETKIANASGVKVKSTRTVSKAPRVASTSATPRVVRDLNSVEAEIFVLSKSAVYSSADDIVFNKVSVISRRPTQVKIAEKFDNLFTSLAGGRKPSTYVMQAFDMLDAKGEITSAEIVAGFKAAGLGDGTAQSQTGQIMVLFNVTGIAARVGQKLTLNADSRIAERIRDLKSPAPTAA